MVQKYFHSIFWVFIIFNRFYGLKIFQFDFLSLNTFSKLWPKLFWFNYSEFSEIFWNFLSQIYFDTIWYFELSSIIWAFVSQKYFDSISSDFDQKLTTLSWVENLSIRFPKKKNSWQFKWIWTIKKGFLEIHVANHSINIFRDFKFGKFVALSLITEKWVLCSQVCKINVNNDMQSVWNLRSRIQIFRDKFLFSFIESKKFQNITKICLSN